MFLSKGRSWHVTTIAGIPIKVHWTFSLLLLFVYYISVQEGLTGVNTLKYFLLIFCLFIFVIMHEYGHALTARRFHIDTLDIIITPIGGVARLLSIPRIPRQELWIALAGPAVNIVLAVIIGVILLLLPFSWNEILDQVDPFTSTLGFLSTLFLVNIILVLFNMLPAFPMDGGRVLRALLSMFMDDHLKATKWASYIGQFCALVFFGLAIYYNHLTLGLVAIFVFVAAKSEYRQLYIENRMNGIKAHEVAIRSYPVIDIEDKQALDPYPASDGYLLVAGDKQVKGFSYRHTLQKNLSHIPSHGPIGEPFGYISHYDSVRHAYNMMTSQGWGLAIITNPTDGSVSYLDKKIIRQYFKTL